MGQNHIAKSGRSAGKWVACSAKIQCQNGGTHLDSAALKEISEMGTSPPFGQESSVLCEQ